MNGGMTTRRPATALAQKRGVRDSADVDFPGSNARSLNLRVALETKVRITFDQQLPVHGTMRRVTHSAAFAQGFVFKDQRTRLLAMTGRAAFVEARHRESAGRLEDVAPVRVVTVHAVQPPFDDRVVVRQIEFRVRLQVTLEAGRRVLAGIDDKLTPTAAHRDVLAARTVARFASRLIGHWGCVKMDAGMWAGRKRAEIIGVTLVARAVTNKRRPRNLRRRKHGARDGGTGVGQQADEQHDEQQ